MLLLPFLLLDTTLSVCRRAFLILSLWLTNAVEGHGEEATLQAYWPPLVLREVDGEDRLVVHLLVVSLGTQRFFLALPKCTILSKCMVRASGVDFRGWPAANQLGPWILRSGTHKPKP